MATLFLSLFLFKEYVYKKFILLIISLIFGENVVILGIIEKK